MDEQINAPTEEQILSLLAQKRFEDEQKLNRTVDADIASNLIKYREAIAGQSPQMQYFPSMHGGFGSAMVDPTIDEKMTAMQRQRDVFNEIERLKKQRASLPSGDVVGPYLTMADMPSAAQTQQAPQAVIAAASEAPRTMQAPIAVQAQPQRQQSPARSQAFLADVQGLLDSIKDPQAKIGIMKMVPDALSAIRRSELASDNIARPILTPEGNATGYAMIGGRPVKMEPQTNSETSAIGFTGSTPTKEEGIKFREALGLNKESNATIDDLLKIADTPGASTDLTIRQRAATNAALLKASIRTDIIGPGAVTETEQKLLDSIATNPAKIFSLSSTDKEALSTLKNRLNSKLENKARAIGLTPAGQQQAMPMQQGGAAIKVIRTPGGLIKQNQ